MASLNLRNEGSVITLVSSATSLSVSDNNFSAISTELDATVTRLPLVDYILTVNFTTAPSANTTIDLYMQRLDVDLSGSGDSIVPSLTHMHESVGAFILAPETGPQSMVISAMLLPPRSAFNIHVNGVGSALPSGWELIARPYGHGD